MELITKKTGSYYLYRWEESLLLIIVVWGGPSAICSGDIMIKFDAYDEIQYKKDGEIFLTNLSNNVQRTIETERVKRDEYWTYEFSHSREVKNNEDIALAYTKYRDGLQK